MAKQTTNATGALALDTGEGGSAKPAEQAAAEQAAAEQAAADKGRSDPAPQPAARQEATPGDAAGDGDRVGGQVAYAHDRDPVTAGFSDALAAKRDQLAEGLRIYLQSMGRPAAFSEAADRLNEREDDVRAAAEASDLIVVEGDTARLAA